MPGSSQHILIVEDEEFVRQLIAAYLEKDGYRLSVAGSAKAMHDVLDRETIDLIILDLGLPDEDGLTLIRQLRTRSPVPIVVLTARQTRADKLTALEIGADDYVTKPVDPQELVLRIANLLRRSGSGGIADAKARDILAFGGWRARFTPLTSRDLAAAAGSGDGSAVDALADRAVSIMARDGATVGLATLDDEARGKILARLETREAAGELLLTLDCPECGHGWAERFDVGGWLWERIEAAGCAIIGEVAVLARAFGWTEREILSLPRRRRLAYLERIAG